MRFLITMLFLLIPSLAFGQVVKEVETGCTFKWDEPVGVNPSPPPNEIGLWDLAGDLAGFAFLDNSEGEGMVWDKLQESRINDKTLRELSCEIFGVTEIGEHTVGIRAYDTSLNMSGTAWINFFVVVSDTTPPGNILRFCLEGKHLGVVAEFCTNIVGTP